MLAEHRLAPDSKVVAIPRGVDLERYDPRRSPRTGWGGQETAGSGEAALKTLEAEKAGGIITSVEATRRGLYL